MKRIATISLGPRSLDCSFTARFLRHDYEVVRVGTDNDFDAAKKLIVEWRDKVDALGLGQVHRHYGGISPTVRILNLVAKTGQAGNAGETSMPWASTATAQALRLSSGRSALGGLPGPRQKVGSVAQTETTGEPRQHVGKVRDGVDLGEFAAGEDRVGNGSALSAGI
jgi:hypothetical protein